MIDEEISLVRVGGSTPSAGPDFMLVRLIWFINSKENVGSNPTHGHVRGRVAASNQSKNLTNMELFDVV